MHGDGTESETREKSTAELLCTRGGPNGPLLIPNCHLNCNLVGLGGAIIRLVTLEALR